jgi:HEAT repeat protein
VLALGRIGPAATPAVPAILRVVHEPDRGLRKYAINALASIGTAEAVRALTALLQGDERVLQIAALKAIQQCGPSAATALPELLEFGVTASDTGLRDTSA